MDTAFKIEGVNVIEEKGLTSKTYLRQIVRRQDTYLLDYNSVFKGMVNNLKYLINKIKQNDNSFNKYLELKYDIDQINNDKEFIYTVYFKIFVNGIEVSIDFINDILNLE